MSKNKLRENVAAYIFLSPILLFFTVFFAFAVGFSVWISFKQWNMLISPLDAPSIGFGNYSSLFSDPLFTSSLINTIVYAFTTTIAILVLSLLIAVALNNIKNAAVWRFIYFSPSITPAVAVGMIWGYLYNPTRGIVNEVLGWFGISAHNWLTDPRYALMAIIITAVWAGMGASILIFTAGLKAIPKSYYDAARIDGASRIKMFGAITLPLLKPTILFLLVTGMLGAWQVFDLIYMMGANAPASSVEVISLYIYNTAFVNLQMGRASAAAMILFVVVLIITMFILRIFRQGGVESYE